MQVNDEDKGPDMTATTWTIAYRKRTANRFLRVASWSGTWAQANALAGLFAEANPTLDVFYVPTAASEVNGASEDAGNILTDSGKRVRIVDTDIPVAAELLDRVPAADIAQQRWTAGERIADPAPVAEPELDEDAATLLATYANGPRIWDAAVIFPIVVRLDSLGLITPASPGGSAYRLTTAGHRALLAAGVPSGQAQIATWADRHGFTIRFDAGSTILAARDLDHMDAIAEDGDRSPAPA